MNVASGAELKLSGTGTISAGTLSLSDSSKLSLEVGTLTSAPITLSGGATLTGAVTLALTLTSQPANGTTFTLIDGSSALAGYSTGARFFANGTALNEGSTFNVTTGGFSDTFQISYVGGSDGDDVTVRVVPEPGALSHAPAPPPASSSARRACSADVAGCPPDADHEQLARHPCSDGLARAALRSSSCSWSLLSSGLSWPSSSQP